MSSKKGAFVYQQIELTTAEWAADTTIYPASIWLFERLETGKFNMKLADGVHVFAELATVMQDIQVAVKTNTADSYVLTFISAGGAIDTPNLKGQNGQDAAIITIDPDTKHMLIGGADTGVKVEGVDGITPVKGTDYSDGNDGFSPSITEDAGNTDKIHKLKITDKNGTVTTPNLRGADGERYHIPTLASAPDETILSYTEEGITKLFDIGYMARVLDAEKDEYFFYQLYNIAEGAAVWKKAGSGGDMQLSETVKITLTSNQAQPDTALNGATIHVTYGDQDISLTWQGQELAATVPMNMTYRVVCPTIDGYTLPEPSEHIALAGNTRGLSFAYNTSVTTITVTADDGTSVAAQTLTVTKVSDSSVIYSGAAGSVVVKIPFGTQYKVSVNAKSGYKTVPDQTLTASEASRTINLVYEKILSSQITFDKSIADPSNISGDINSGIIAQILAKGRRCLCKKSANGEVTICYLKDTDSNYYADNTSAVLTSGEGDVMVDFPEIYYKYVTTGGVKYAYRFAQYNVDGTYKHVKRSLLGAYKGYITGSKLYSRSGVIPTASTSYTDYFNAAAARGAGYQMIDFEQHNVIAFMLYAKYGTRDLQSVLGRGGANYSPATTTGTTNQKGNRDTVGETVGYVNGLGIEGVFGGFYEWVQGVTIQNSVWSITDPDGTKRTVNGHTSGGWITNVAAEAGPYFDMVPVGTGGSETTHYSDYHSHSSSGPFCLLRSHYGTYTNGGPACAYANSAASHTSTNIAGRLAFRGVIREASSVAAFKALSVL